MIKRALALITVPLLVLAPTDRSQSAGLRVAVSFPKDRSAAPLDGR